MAPSNPRPPTPQHSRSAENTRSALVIAAADALRDVGFAHASAREIARRVGCNQALIFYHFGTVTDLHLAALDHVSDTRRERYLDAVPAQHGDLRAALRRARLVLTEDLDQGYLAILATMIAAAQADPDLGPRVAERIRPWRHFAAESVRNAVSGLPLGSRLPSDDLAHAIVALYLGLEMLASLDGDRTPATRLFDHADRVAALVPRINLTRNHKRPKRPSPAEAPS